MNRVITEGLGTFFWVFAVIAATSIGSPLAAFAIGGTVLAAIYAGVKVSGAHYNPAVSIAAFVRGRLAGADLPAYIGAQLAGASVASLLAPWAFRMIGATQPVTWGGRTLVAAIVVELVFTFFLAFVALTVADSENAAFYGLAVGAVVTAGTVLATMQSGAVFNPAVAVGTTFAQLSAWANLWAYLLAQLVAGALAGLAAKALRPADDH